MAYSIDANVLLYASDTESPIHERAASFLDRCVTEPETFYIGWPTAMAYLRIATHPSIFTIPLTPEEAQTNIQTLQSLPHVRFLSEGAEFWRNYGATATAMAIRGNLVPDAHLATLLREHGIRRLYTRDRDFRKFDFLDAIDPFD